MTDKLSWDIDDPHGYGTYQLGIKIDETSTNPFKVQVSSVRSTSALYVNGQPIGGAGEVGKTELTTKVHHVLACHLPIFATILYLIGISDRRLLSFAIVLIMLALLNLLSGDENRLVQVMFNLLHNAIKYMLKGRIELISELKGNDVHISFKDTGVEMDQVTFSRIFNPYSQGRHQDYLDQGGFGIGLYVSKQLIELHKGELIATPKLGQGSTFTFLLPIVKSTGVITEQIENGGKRWKKEKHLKYVQRA